MPASKNSPFFLCWGLWAIPLQENGRSIWKLPMATRGTSWPLNPGDPVPPLGRSHTHSAPTAQSIQVRASQISAPGALEENFLFPPQGLGDWGGGRLWPLTTLEMLLCPHHGGRGWTVSRHESRACSADSVSGAVSCR